MYKVLLVDDERLILEGISRVVDWHAAGTELAGTAKNGIEAMDKIEALRPEIVITDIAMPGLDGLGLAERASGKYPNMKFVMLTGYKDFDYARTAMKFGVKHYLLKPCNEGQIHKALLELVEECRCEDEREEFLNVMKERFTKMLPHVKEQFLKEWISNKNFGNRDLEYYQELFGMELGCKEIRLLLLRLEDSYEYEHLFALQNIARDIVKDVLFASTIGGDLLIMAEHTVSESMLLAQVEEVRSVFRKFYNIEVTAAVSDPGPMPDSRRLYRQTLQCMNHRFYLGKGSMITQGDLPQEEPSEALELNMNEEEISRLIKAGDKEAVEQELNLLFGKLSDMRLEIGVTRSYVLQLYSAMIRLCPPEERAAFTSGMASLAETTTLSGLEVYVKEAAERLTSLYERQHVSRHFSVVSKMIQIIEDNYHNEDLSLGYVAGEMLYMNPDYLGKIFKKVTGEKFSNYVTRIRIEKASEYILRSGDVKVFELAGMFGFGCNAQYFSQVFKKVTGRTPTDFMKV
ncbi:response regulator [Paenibacillus sp. M1]|uniref:Response regulator n=1 Tax=Paenibacillus haidiansis TaxID=1574488 RepID=A0ABU7VT38_9BACL